MRVTCKETMVDVSTSAPPSDITFRVKNNTSKQLSWRNRTHQFGNAHTELLGCGALRVGNGHSTRIKLQPVFCEPRRPLFQPKQPGPALPARKIDDVRFCKIPGEHSIHLP